MLSLDLATILFQAVNFIVLAAVLNRFLFQPVVRRATERAEERDRLMRELAEERRAAAALRAELEQKWAELEEEREASLKKMRREAERERQSLLAQARAEAEQILVEAQVDAYRLREQVLQDFHEQLVDAILGTSGTLAGRVAPALVHDTLVQDLANRIRDMGRDQMERVEAMRRSLAGRDAVAHVSSARELSADQQVQLARILSALADQPVDMEVDVSPDLVAGVRIRLGDTVIDNSLAGQLQELRQEASRLLKEQVESA